MRLVVISSGVALTGAHTVSLAWVVGDAASGSGGGGGGGGGGDSIERAGWLAGRVGGYPGVVADASSMVLASRSGW